MPTTAHTPPPATARPDARFGRGQGPLLQRWLQAFAGLAAAGLLLAFVQTCQESVRNGQRWRAEQHAQPRAAADAGAAPRASTPLAAYQGGPGRRSPG